MAVSTTVLDASANYMKTNGTKIIVCSQLPSTRAQADTYKLAEATVTFTGPTDITNGRKVSTSAVSGTVATSGTAAYAVVVSATDILGTKQLTGKNAQALTEGNTFNLGVLDFNITSTD